MFRKDMADYLFTIKATFVEPSICDNLCLEYGYMCFIILLTYMLASVK